MGAHGVRVALLVAALAASVVWVLYEADLFEPGKAERGARNFVRFVSLTLPPTADAESAKTLGASLLETLRMAWAGTLLGALLALPLAILAASPLSGAWVARPVRAFLAGVRTIPSILWAVIFVIVVGLGPLAGILALTAYTIGYLGKLFYEALEAVDPETLDAHRATGASRMRVARHAAVPEAGNALLSQCVFAFEYNVRASSILGLVGAGGIGFQIQRALDLLDYQLLLTTLLVLFALVLLVDAGSRLLRTRFLATRA